MYEKNKKRIEELDLMDDFLFTEASTDPQTAPLLMRLIIVEGKTIRLFDVEPNNIKEVHLLKRTSGYCPMIHLD